MVGLLGAVSCGDVSRTGRAPAFLVIDTLRGSSGAAAGAFGDTLQSDVVTGGSVFEDLGQVQLRVLLRDQGSPGSTAGPSNLNWLKINRYRVVFKRADGRNTPGVDVPYPFDGAITTTVTNQPQFTTFVLVRAQSKVEAPLFALRSSNGSFGGGAAIISAIADVTFYGEDLAGNGFAETAAISVNFADWADPVGSESE
jgi:hypothetical protein